MNLVCDVPYCGRSLGYRQLVEAIVSGTETEPEKVERLLSESGETLENPPTDRGKLSCRKQLRATPERRPALRKERARLDDQFALADGHSNSLNPSTMK